MTVRGDVALVTSVHPDNVAELPLMLAEPVHVVAPVTVQLTVNGVPVTGAADTVNRKLSGVGGAPPPPPHPVPESVTPVAVRSVPPGASVRPFASVTTSQFVCCVVVRWMVTWALAVPRAPNIAINAGRSEAVRRNATDIGVPT